MGTPTPIGEYPPQLDPEQVDHLLSEIKGYSSLNGLAVKPATSFVPPDIDPSRSLTIPAPVTLFPSLFPRGCFEEARTLQAAYNALYVAITRDEGWLASVVKELLEVDEFIRDLWTIHLNVKEEGYVQDLSLGIFRSDYMVHEEPSLHSAMVEIKQIEFNTIASSFGGLATKVSALHRHLQSVRAYPDSIKSLLSSEAIPVNPSVKSIARGLAEAHRAYGSPRSSTLLPLCIIFVVQDPENNIFDQLAVSSEIQTTYNIEVFRLPFRATGQYIHIPKDNKMRPLVYTPPHAPSHPYEVSTLYFRAGYSPEEYDTRAWTSRYEFERSAAIKCPSILTHLAGSKKVQQMLATPSSPYLERFLSSTPSRAYIERIRHTFAPIYPLDDSDAGKEGISIAMDPEKAKNYVLKPQREGGGNNVYGVKIPPFLEALGSDKRKYRSYILMEIIRPPALRNSIYRNGAVKTGGVIGELGVYGICLWRHGPLNQTSGSMLENYEGGYLLRTKGDDSEEGGVAAGFGCVDSVCLID